MAIKNSKHIIEFLLEKTLQNFNGDNRKIGREIKEKILPFINILPSAIEKAHFLKRINDLTAISTSALEEDLKKIEKEQKYEKNEIENTIEKNSLHRQDYIERKLLGIIFWQKSLPAGEIYAENILNELSAILKKNKKEILENNDNNKEDLIFEAEVFYKNAPFDKDVQELIANLKEEYIKEELHTKIQALNKAETEKNKNESLKILQEISELNQKIQNIKNGRFKQSSQ